MLKSRTFVFDVDGCLADFILGFTTLAHKYDTTIPFYSTYQQKVWGQFSGMTAKQEDDTWKIVDNDTQFWENLEPLGDYVEWERLKDLHAVSTIYFATSRRGIDPRGQTINFLEKQGIYRPQVIVTSMKGIFCKCVRAKYAIDDKADNAQAIAWIAEWQGGRTVPYILDRPYNRYNDLIIGSKHVVRTYSLGGFLDACFTVL